jgi:hypothetical protein
MVTYISLQIPKLIEFSLNMFTLLLETISSLMQFQSSYIGALAEYISLLNPQ